MVKIWKKRQNKIEEARQQEKKTRRIKENKTQQKIRESGSRYKGNPTPTTGLDWSAMVKFVT